MALETKRKKTKICCLDLDKDCLNLLNERFDVYDGSLGKPIDVSGKNYRGLNLLLNYELPQNIHEYDIFIEDMVKSDKIPYNKEENTRMDVVRNPKELDIWSNDYFVQLADMMKFE